MQGPPPDPPDTTSHGKIEEDAVGRRLLRADRWIKHLSIKLSEQSESLFHSSRCRQTIDWSVLRLNQRTNQPHRTPAMEHLYLNVLL